MKGTTMTMLTDKAHEFLAKNPTHLGTIAGDMFYAHPIHGDEVPLYAIMGSGHLKRTTFYDVPTLEEWLSVHE